LPAAPKSQWTIIPASRGTGAWSRGKLIALGLCAAILLALALPKALSIAFSIARANRTAAATTSASIDIDGRTRTYLFHTPPGYDRHRKTPLVFVLHGATRSPEGVERLSGMSAWSDREKFLVAYPGGTGRLSRVPTWNAGSCCGYALTHKSGRRVLYPRLDRQARARLSGGP
jgi:poly(3-hydroxybutyrate) depolymerase